MGCAQPPTPPPLPAPACRALCAPLSPRADLRSAALACARAIRTDMRSARPPIFLRSFIAASKSPRCSSGIRTCSSSWGRRSGSGCSGASRMTGRRSSCARARVARSPPVPQLTIVRPRVRRVSAIRGTTATMGTATTMATGMARATVTERAALGVAHYCPATCPAAVLACAAGVRFWASPPLCFWRVSCVRWRWGPRSGLHLGPARRPQLNYENRGALVVRIASFCTKNSSLIKLTSCRFPHPTSFVPFCLFWRRVNPPRSVPHRGPPLALCHVTTQRESLQRAVCCVVRACSSESLPLPPGR